MIKLGIRTTHNLKKPITKNCEFVTVTMQTFRCNGNNSTIQEFVTVALQIYKKFFDVTVIIV